MNYSVRHELPERAQVKNVVEKAYASYADRLEKYRPVMRWESDSRATVQFTVMSQKIDAELSFDDTEIRFQGKIPLLFRAFQGKVESVLARELDKWLTKARNGELDEAPASGGK